MLKHVKAKSNIHVYLVFSRGFVFRGFGGTCLCTIRLPMISKQVGNHGDTRTVVATEESWASLPLSKEVYALTVQEINPNSHSYTKLHKLIGTARMPTLRPVAAAQSGDRKDN